MKKMTLLFIGIFILSGCTDNGTNGVTGKNKTPTIVDEISMQETSWAYNVYEPKSVVENSDVIVRAKIRSISDPYLLKDTNTYYPYTDYQIEIIEEISGNGESVSLFMAHGGKISISELIDMYPNDQELEKRGYYDYEGDKDNAYIDYQMHGESTLEQDKEYVFMLSYDQASDKYYLPAGGYNVFVEVDDKTRNENDTHVYENIVTNNTIEENEVEK